MNHVSIHVICKHLRFSVELHTFLPHSSISQSCSKKPGLVSPMLKAKKGDSKLHFSLDIVRRSTQFYSKAVPYLFIESPSTYADVPNPVAPSLFSPNLIGTLLIYGLGFCSNMPFKIFDLRNLKINIFPSEQLCLRAIRKNCFQFFERYITVK